MIFRLKVMLPEKQAIAICLLLLSTTGKVLHRYTMSGRRLTR